jgi:hypothetical protein
VVVVLVVLVVVITEQQRDMMLAVLATVLEENTIPQLLPVCSVSRNRRIIIIVAIQIWETIGTIIRCKAKAND